MTAALSPDLLVEALFVSDLQCSDAPAPKAIRDAVDAAVRRFGEAGCAAQVAQEYGEHPDCACARMQWVRSVVLDAFAS